MVEYTHLTQAELDMLEAGIQKVTSEMPIINGRSQRLNMSDIMKPVHGIVDVLRSAPSKLGEDGNVKREVVSEIVSFSNLKFVSQYPYDDLEYLEEVKSDLAWILSAELSDEQREKVNVLDVAVAAGLAGDLDVSETLQALRFDGIRAVTLFERNDPRREMLTEIMMLDTYISLYGREFYDTAKEIIAQENSAKAPGM